MPEDHISQIAALAGASVEFRRECDHPKHFVFTEAQLTEFVRLIDSGSAAAIALADVLEQRGLKPVLKVG